MPGLTATIVYELPPNVVFGVPSTTVTVRKDKEKEYIDIGLDELELNKFYLVFYKGELHAVRKLSDNEIGFYDVIT